jgi:threonine dehydrogenase-like Zn-dependent dehydrogenase
MRSVVLDYQRHELLQRDVPPPSIKLPADVLFRVAEVGVCGTDRELANFQLGYPPAGGKLYGAGT